ncbi:ABC transporter ATP-binding protein [Paenibacillus baekrokdamisoli]|uniref:ABC transporter ATP-binding protein n=1 Tax=Paenibacillus baekrokdamisoli TaxID=1712516 RepID=A0A3G9IJC9_9BACL|nr:ABC transporter ATP-binding protein [Paenibacillus baekrokdamisoli]MBB3067708.1 ABC-2 type transport system ATP-binding protein [Paenibacillus baekrokdamisoli]BBH19107.1 ABC transporter ATP-binding protein [Paenibacillus baekrokdamisoli]
MKNIVEVNGLTKTYGNVAAVHDVSFTLDSDKIYGLLGRNGAGKTTIMHMIAAQQFATKGEIKLFGETPYENNKVLSQLCFIKESQKYPDSFRIVDVLHVAATLFSNWDQKFAELLIEDFRLPIKRRMKKLSRGMLSSVGIIIGLASRAPLTMFDEPYIGLDAVARGVFYNRLIEDYALYPRTILLSTHLIDEVSQILEHVLIIDGGKLMMNEDADFLRGLGCTVIGLSTAVEAFTAGREVINRESLGGMIAITITGKLSAEDRLTAAEQGLQLSPVSMQQLIVHMTSQKKERKEVL